MFYSGNILRRKIFVNVSKNSDPDVGLKKLQYAKVKRENQQDATNSMLIIKLLSQHVSGIIMPIIRRIRPCSTACGILPGCVGCGWLWSCGAASWSVCTVWKLLGIMMPGTYWDRSWIINIELVACCWFSLSLHLMFTMRGHKNLKLTIRYKISWVQWLINNLNAILHLSTCHTVYISALILFMIMP